MDVIPSRHEIETPPSQQRCRGGVSTGSAQRQLVPFGSRTIYRWTVGGRNDAGSAPGARSFQHSGIDEVADPH
jgi:hypothetical protein